ncbi:MAG: AI-2E family transporter [Clostridia bacterium]|nr:AI-2E family transporter [Clostridia bacterium]
MFKFTKNEKYASIAFYAGCVVVTSVLIILAIFNFGTLWKYVKSILAVLSPFVYGFVFAYLTQPIMSFYERTIFSFKKSKKNRFALRRALSLTLTIITVIAFLSVIIYSIVPGIAGSIESLGSQLNNYIANLQSFADETVAKFSGTLLGKEYSTLSALLAEHDIKFSIKDILQASYISMQGAVDYIINYGSKIVSEIINILMGCFVAVYFLINKEKVTAQIKKLMAAIMSRRAYLNTVRLARYTHKTFGGFIVGKLIDSIIIGFISLFVFWIFRIPYYPLLSVIIGLTNIIPTFGPIIGGVIGGVLLLIVSPSKLIAFVIIVLAIQQFDGNILGPKILGESIGLSAMWVMIAIVAAGGFFGFTGMIVGVPATAVVYVLLKQWTERRLRRKNMPYHTKFYATDPPLEENVDPAYVLIGKDTPIPEITAEDDAADEPPREKIRLTDRIKKLTEKKKKEEKK